MWQGQDLPHSIVVRGNLKRAMLQGLIFLLLIFSLASIGCSKPEAHAFGEAEGALRVGSYELAAKYYEGYLQKYPHGEFAERSLYNLGNVYYLRLRDAAKAQIAYEQFLKKYSTSQYAFTTGERLAQLYERDLKDIRKAIEVLEEISLRTPSRNEWRRVRLEIATDYFRLDEFDQALLEYKRLIDDQPKEKFSDEARLKMAAIFEIRKQWREATAQLREVIDHSQCAECKRHAQFEIVDCYESLEQYDQALAVLESISPSPEDKEFLGQRLAALKKKTRELNTQREVNWERGRQRAPRANSKVSRRKPASAESRR